MKPLKILASAARTGSQGDGIVSVTSVSHTTRSGPLPATRSR